MIFRSVIITIFSSLIILYLFAFSYSLSRLLFYFSINFNINPVILFFMIVIIFYLAFFLQNKLNNYFSHIFYNSTYILIATSIYFTMVFVAVEILIFLFNININNLYIAFTTLTITLIVLLYSFFNRYRYKITQVNINSKKISKDTKIVQLSDNHIYGKHSYKRFNNVFKKIFKINPDYVVITGDLFDKPGKVPLDVLKITKQFKNKIFFVYGNHDIIYGVENVKKIIKNTDIITLNASNYLDKKTNINFFGVSYNIKKNNLKENLEKMKINKENYNILLYHEPKEVLNAQKKKIDLMLSGHTHGGHLFPLTLFIRFVYKYYKGFYSFKTMKLYVSEGTEEWGPRMRLGSKNEIVIINLLKK